MSVFPEFSMEQMQPEGGANEASPIKVDGVEQIAAPSTPAKSDPTTAPSKKAKSGKVAAIVDAPKNFRLSYFYGGISAVALGLSLVFAADLGERHDGLKSPACLWPGCLFTWIMYHCVSWLLWKSGKSEDAFPGKAWFSKERSMYYEMFFDEDGEGE